MEKNKTNLLIVESPAKAKTIKKYLGRNYTVLASMGHLRDLPKSQLGIDVDNNFSPKYITIRGKGDITSALKKAAKSSKKIFIATDPDREGEAIAWHIAAMLNLPEDSPCRVTFNEITKTAVTASVKAPRCLDMDLVNAQQARRILDRLLGYKLSPLLWHKVGSGLSAGRVQSVATKMIVDREREIDEFTPTEYHTLSALLKTGEGKETEAHFHGIKGKKTALSSVKDVEMVKALLTEDYTVKSVKYSDKHRSPQPPFTTSSMQQEASKRLGFTAKRTMSAAQLLYEGVEIEGHGVTGLITYMRTDSLRISDEAASMASEYILSKYGKEYLPPSKREYKAKKGAQDAHEAIRPTTLLEPEAVKKSLSADCYKLYKLIWARFMASQMANASYNTMSADIISGDCLFKASESKLAKKGYTVLYSEENEEGKKGQITLLTDGEKLNLISLDDALHYTEAPPRYTEASIIKAMEENGIGRPSTYAPTISTILGRKYVERDKKTLFPTELGKIITDLLSDRFKTIVDIEFTAGMESGLDEIDDGEKEWTEVVRDFYEPFSQDLAAAEEELMKVDIADEETDIPCDICGRKLVIKNGRFGRFMACPGYPECSFTKAIFDETGVACPECGSMIIGRHSKKGKKYYPCSSKDCNFVLWDLPTGERCEKCSSLMVNKRVRGKDVIRCSNRECEASK